MTEIESHVRTLCENEVQRIVFSEKADKDGRWEKAVIRATGGGAFQLEKFTEKQAFHENFTREALAEKVLSLLPAVFLQAEVFTAAYLYGVRITKKGKLLHNRRKNDAPRAEKSAGNDREKRYLLDAEHLPPVFEELGVLSHDGKILRHRYDKFRQICRFTELVDDVLKADKREELHILDFGCGKSYLTFVLYHYITEILHKKAFITGLDLKEDVIDRCEALAEKYGYGGLRFLCTDVEHYADEKPVDMVISLHACDTATDFALAFAVKRGADYVFSVPCCHKELRRKMAAKALGAMGDYGIVLDRAASLATDVMRAKLLEANGYRAELAEFVDLENTPKNLLLRARRSHGADRFRADKAAKDYAALKDRWGAGITLETLLAR